MSNPIIQTIETYLSLKGSWGTKDEECQKLVELFGPSSYLDYYRMLENMDAKGTIFLQDSIHYHRKGSISFAIHFESQPGYWRCIEEGRPGKWEFIEQKAVYL